jgi:hypothetical protein
MAFKRPILILMELNGSSIVQDINKIDIHQFETLI